MFELNREIANPTERIELNFSRYLAAQEQLHATRTESGIPTYAFSLDAQLRQKIAKVRLVRDLAQALTSLSAPLRKQQNLLSGIAVQPDQYPQVYAMGEECARILGIGVPQIFIMRSEQINALAYATDDVEPVIVINTALIEVMELNELKFIIGHECGHIHNLHSVYNVAADMIANPASDQFVRQMVRAGMAARLISSMIPLEMITRLIHGVVAEGLRLFFLNWSRCAEITCDRAGLICCGNLHDAQYALAKLKIGGLDALAGFNIDAYLRQISATSTVQRLSEINTTHPLIPRRIEALRVFNTCETLYDWRPEMRGMEASISRIEADKRCEQLINVFTKDLR